MWTWYAKSQVTISWRKCLHGKISFSLDCTWCACPTALPGPLQGRVRRVSVCQGQLGQQRGQWGAALAKPGSCLTTPV